MGAHESEPEYEQARERRVIEEVFSGRIDPLFFRVRDEISEAQTRLDEHECTDKQTDVLIDSLNRTVDEMVPFGTEVTVSGKVRLTCLDDDDTVFKFAANTCVIHEDEHGRYINVEGQPFIFGECAIPYSNDNDIDDEGSTVVSDKIGVTFIECSSIDSAECVVDAGEYLMYPNEIDRFELKQPSADLIKERLSYHCPTIWRRLEATIPQGTEGCRNIVAALKQFYCRTDEMDGHGLDLDTLVGQEIYNRIDFDTSMYHINVDGPISSVSAKEEQITSPDDTKATVRGYICGIRLMPDDESEYLRPCLIVGALQPEFCGDLAAYLIPAESLISLRNMRRTQLIFGKKALYEFASQEEIRDYFLQSDNVDPETDTVKEVTNDVTALAAIDCDLPRYDEVRKCYTVSVDADIRAAINTYWDLVQARHAAVGRDLEVDDYSAVARKFARRAISFERLKTEDLIIIDRDVTISVPGEDDIVYRLEQGESLQGELVGFDIAQFAPPIEDCESMTEGDVIEGTWGLGMVLGECTLIGTNSESHRVPWGAAPIVVALSTMSDPHVLRVDMELTSAMHSRDIH